MLAASLQHPTKMYCNVVTERFKHTRIYCIYKSATVSKDLRQDTRTHSTKETDQKQVVDLMQTDWYGIVR